MARIVQYPILQLNSFWIKMSKFPPLWDIHWTRESRVRTDLVLWVQILDRQTKTWTWRSRLQILDRPYFFLIFDKVCTDVGQRLDKVFGLHVHSVQPPIGGELREICLAIWVTGSYAPNTVDGNMDTFWQSAQNYKRPWIQFDMKASYSVEKVRPAFIIYCQNVKILKLF